MPSKRGLKRGLNQRQRTVVLFTDATIVTEVPPLRGAWAPRGVQVNVPITGSHARRIIYGALNPRTGRLLLEQASAWNQATFQPFLRHLRAHWRGWRIILFLDRGSPHRAKRTRQLARELRIELRWLPTACPRLNPLDDLWRHVKRDVLANEPVPNVHHAVDRACAYLLSLAPRARLRKAGVLSGNFWLD